MQAEDERERADALAERAARPNLEDAAEYRHQLRGRLDTDLSPTLGARLLWTPPHGNTNCLHDSAPARTCSPQPHSTPPSAGTGPS